MNFSKELSLFLILVLYSCTGGVKESNTPNEAVEQATTHDGVLERDSKINFKLLQGKWKSIEDETNLLIFENNHRKEIAQEMSDWDDQIFTLSDRCLDDIAKNDSPKPEKNKYISCKASNECWYIIKLDSTELTFSYPGHPRTFSYSKVKD